MRDAALLMQLDALAGLWPLQRVCTSQRTTDQIRSDYISSSHTRLIRCLTHWVHLMQASIDKPDNSN